MMEGQNGKQLENKMETVVNYTVFIRGPLPHKEDCGFPTPNETHIKLPQEGKGLPIIYYRSILR